MFEYIMSQFNSFKCYLKQLGKTIKTDKIENWDSDPDYYYNIG